MASGIDFSDSDDDMFFDIGDSDCKNVFQEESEKEVIVREEDLVSDYEEDDTLLNIPEIVYVDDDQQVFCESVQASSPPSKKRLFNKSAEKPILTCSKCGKIYKSPSFWRKHEDSCQGTSSGTVHLDTNFASKKEAFKESVGSWIKAALDSATKDQFFNLAEPGKTVSVLAANLLQKFDKEDENTADFIINITESFEKILSKKKITSSEREHLFKSYFKVTTNDVIILLWNDLISGYNYANMTLFGKPLLQFVLDRILQQGISFCKPKKENIINVQALKMSTSEEQTLRYVAGFIAFSIKKNVKSPKSPEGTAVLAILDRWGNKDNEINSDTTFTDYTRAWVDSVNRGGLFVVNNAFFKLITSIENVARTVLNINLMSAYCGEDIKEVILRKLKGNCLIEEKWAALTNGIDCNVTLISKLRDVIFRKWVNIRAPAFVKVWLQIMKEKTRKKGETVVEKGEPSLRKTLFSKKSKNAKKHTKSSPVKTVAAKKLKLAKKTLRKKK